MEPSQNNSSSRSAEKAYTESPPVQAMEHPVYMSSRIPSSVFEIDQSSDPLQWSVSSNDSLFSINIGNISMNYGNSFPDDHEMLDEASMDCPFQSSIHSPYSVKSKAMEMPLDTVEEDSRENEEQNQFSEGRESNASVKSFAFPILTGELDKGSPGKFGSPAKLIAEQQPAPQPKQETEPSPKQEKDPNQQVVQKRWFSCFCCCQ